MTPLAFLDTSPGLTPWGNAFKLVCSSSTHGSSVLCQELSATSPPVNPSSATGRAAVQCAKFKCVPGRRSPGQIVKPFMSINLASPRAVQLGQVVWTAVPSVHQAMRPLKLCAEPCDCLLTPRIRSSPSPTSAASSPVSRAYHLAAANRSQPLQWAPFDPGLHSLLLLLFKNR